MQQGLFIELWQGVRDLMQDNATTEATRSAKRFINWTLNDLSCAYNWEFLRGSLTLTATGGASTYDLSQISQLTATATTVYAQCASTADAGTSVFIFGKQIPGSNSNLVISNSEISVATTATASGGNTFSHIDSITRPIGSGNVIITTGSGSVIATLGPTTTYMSNDISKITRVTDLTNSRSVPLYGYDDYVKGNPNDSNLDSNYPAYDTDYSGYIRFMNISAGDCFQINYQRQPRYLSQDQDRSEFPYFLYQKIIDSSYQGYGLRFQDEADAQIGKARYLDLLDDIVSCWKRGTDQGTSRIMPAWLRRTL